MLENARRQVILVLLILAAALAVLGVLPPQLGPDLRGGIQMIYEVREDVLQKQVAADPQTNRDALMDQTVAVIAERLDPTGVIDALVSRRGTNGVLIEMPNMSPAELKAAEDRISSLGKLEMRIVAGDDYDKNGVKFNLANEKKRLQDWLNGGGKALVVEDFKNIENFNSLPTAQGGPEAYGQVAWFAHFVVPSTKSADVWEYSFAKDSSLPAVAVFEDTEWNNRLITEDMKKKPANERRLLEFLAINMNEVKFTGEDLEPSGVRPDVSSDGSPAVAYLIKAARASEYADWSEQYIGKNSAIILNNVVKSAPVFRSRIPGRGQISGNFTQPEVQELVKVLRTGSLKVEPELQSKEVIGPTLGEQSVKLGFASMLAGAAAVFAFMLYYYRLAGVVACVALLLNMVLLYASVVFLQATLTLPGIGGMVLTMGMAVDANVLIYERIREEIARGKDMLQAVRAGFERAMSAIVDSNVTTFLIGIILYNAGVGPVRGFAVTLMVGIATTLFTQFFVTRLIFHYLVEGKKLVSYNARQWFSTIQVDFVRHIKVCVVASALFLLGGTAYATFGIPREVLLGLDFTGGANLTMVVDQPQSSDEVVAKLTNDAGFTSKFRSPQVNTMGTPDAQGRSTSFNMRLKLTDELRAQIETDRNAWRAQRDAAKEAGQPAPADYVPPYIAELQRLFGDNLVKPGFSGAKVETLPNGAASAQINLHFQSPVVVAAALEKLVAAKLPSVAVTADPAGAGESRNLFVEWNVLPTIQSVDLFPIVNDALMSLTDTAGKAIVLSDPFPEAEEIQGRMVGELRNAAISALILSMALIVFYLRVRFHEYAFGFAAVVALVHDVLVAFVVVAIFNRFGLVSAELNLNMIACFLTIVGYSVNDTIVIFDRIRENLHEQERTGEKISYSGLINRSLNQTLSRTLLTSGVTLFVVIAQFVVNYGSGSDLEAFSFAMMVGMVSGVYSTVYIAAPILIWMRGKGASTPAVKAPESTATAS